MDLKGDTATSNGIQSERLMNDDGEYGDHVHGGEKQIGNRHQGVYDRNDEEGLEGRCGEDSATDSSWEFKGGRSENSGVADHGSLIDSISALESAEEALRKELEKFREIGIHDVAADDLVQDFSSDFTSTDPTVQETNSSKQLQSSKHLEEPANRDAERELEDIFRRKIEAEVEYLAISTTLRKCRVAARDQITLLEDSKSLAPKTAPSSVELVETKRRPVMRNIKAENSLEEIASVDEALKLSKRIWKYTSCLFIQLILMVILLEVFISQLSSYHATLVPT